MNWELIAGHIAIDYLILFKKFWILILSMFEGVRIDCQEMEIRNKVLLHWAQFMTHKKVSLKSAHELRTLNRREDLLKVS